MNKTFSIQADTLKVKSSDLLLLEKVIHPKSALKFHVIMSGRSSITFSFEVLSDHGRFVNFCGVMVNTESGDICLGYNANNDMYIPIANLVDILNAKLIMQGSGFPEFTLDDVLVFIENYKMDYTTASPVSYFNDLLKGRLSTNNVKYSYRSIALNYLKEKRGASTGSVVDPNNPNAVNVLDVMSDDDFYRVVMSDMANINTWCKVIGQEFLGNYILEDDFSTVGSTSSRSKHTTMYLNSISRGADAEFMKELTSLGFAIKRRLQAYDMAIKGSKPIGFMAALLSSNAYADAYQDDNFDKISVDKIRAYNLADLLRTLDRDQDLYFSQDELLGRNPSKAPSTSYMDALLKKLGLEAAFAGLKSASTFIDGYSKLLDLNDMGSDYTIQVKGPQRDFAPVAVRSLSGAGRLVNKMCGRILKKF